MADTGYSNTLKKKKAQRAWLFVVCVCARMWALFCLSFNLNSCLGILHPPSPPPPCSLELELDRGCGRWLELQFRPHGEAIECALSHLPSMGKEAASPSHSAVLGAACRSEQSRAGLVLSLRPPSSVSSLLSVVLSSKERPTARVVAGSGLPLPPASLA